MFDADAVRAAQREAWARWIASDPMAPASVTRLLELWEGFDAHDRPRPRRLVGAHAPSRWEVAPWVVME